MEAETRLDEGGTEEIAQEIAQETAIDRTRAEIVIAAQAIENNRMTETATEGEMSTMGHGSVGMMIVQDTQGLVHARVAARQLVGNGMVRIKPIQME